RLAEQNQILVVAHQVAIHVAKGVGRPRGVALEFGKPILSEPLSIEYIDLAIEVQIPFDELAEATGPRDVRDGYRDNQPVFGAIVDEQAELDIFFVMPEPNIAKVARAVLGQSNTGELSLQCRLAQAFARLLAGEYHPVAVPTGNSLPIVLIT